MTLVLISAAENSCGGSNFPGVALRMEIWRDNSGSGVNAAANTETVQGRLMLVRRGSGGTGSFNNNGVCSALAGADGSTRYSAGGLNYDFRSTSGMGSPGATLMLWQGDFVVAHNTDGTKTLSYSGSWTGDSNVGSTSVAGSVSLPTIVLAPTAPTSVAAVRVSDSEVTLSWAQSNPGQGQPSANEYRRRVNGGSWSSPTSISPTTSVSVPASGNQKVEFQVRASNAGGTSAWSDVSAPVYTTPAAPTGVTATKDANLDIDIAWTPQVAFSEHEHVIEESTDGGSTWAPLTTVSAGTTSFKHVDPNPATTHRYQVRARNTSGGLTSAWVQSPIVQLLAAPNKPTLPDLPDYVAREVAFRLPWTHNPVDTTAQTAYEVEHSINGGSSWTSTGKQTSTSQHRDFAGGTYPAGTELTVRVRTWGQASTGGAEGTGASPWSDPQTVTFKSAPVATILSPADASTWGEATLVAALGFSQAEAATFVQATAVLSDGVSDLETVVSGSLSGITFSTPVANGGTYTVTATVLDSNGVTSAPVVAEFDVAYTLPVPAGVTITWLRDRGWAQLDIAIAAPGVGEAAATAVTIARTFNGVTETVVAAYPIAEPGQTFHDTTPPIRGELTYLVRTISGDGAINDVTEVFTPPADQWAFLSSGPGFANVVRFSRRLRLSSTPRREATLVVTAGRSTPIAMFGPLRSLEVGGSAIVLASELASLIGDVGSSAEEIEEFLLTSGLACLRDPTGRVVFGVVRGDLRNRGDLSAEFSFTVSEAT